jgi:hypothetical protein
MTIVPSRASVNHGPSFAHAPDEPLRYCGSTTSPFTEIENVSELLSSHRYRNTEYVPAGMSFSSMRFPPHRLLRIIFARSGSVGGTSGTFWFSNALSFDE